jgi:Trk K+ transport system NAD-binding subunit
VLPIFTIIILGEGVVRVLAIYLRRDEHLEEWDRMVANTFSQHTVICGVGELGRAIFKRLITQDPDAQVVLVDSRPDIPGELGLLCQNICQIQADMTTSSSLKAANCQAADVIILVSGNDAFNLEAGFKAQELNPQAEIWIRLYRIGLAGLMDLRTKGNVHFFSPNERAAEALVSDILNG